MHFILKIKKLRCEYRENPVGIGVKKPMLSWQLESDKRNILQSAYRIQVSKDGEFASGIVWDTGIVKSQRSIHIEYDGKETESCTRYFYRVMVWDNKGESSGWSETCFWETGLLKTEEWRASWIIPPADASTDVPSGACPMLRRMFRINGKVKAARIYASALGLYELHINGLRVGDCYFTPGWTSYDKRLQYQTYDVTGLLKNGINAAGAILGNGWYKGNIAGKVNLYGDRVALLFQLHISYEDGKEDIVVSDDNWEASAGPILMSEIYHGETYDARLERDGWSTPEYDAVGWYGVTCLEHTMETLVAQESVPVRIIQEITPAGFIKTPKGDTVIDFGQNMTGWVRLKAEGPSETLITLQHAEILDREGNFYTDNLRKAGQTVQYTMKGGGEESFRPHFTFQGFRFVKITGYPGELKTCNFTGEVIHSDMEPTGSFRCSDELVNRLQHNIVWGQKDNFLDIPTDCPQRDERLGWTGDAQIFIRTACFNMNVAPFFTKWLRDLHADQIDGGSVPFTIPDVSRGRSRSSAVWGDAAVICPWTVYTCYGDIRVLEEQYESMKKWIEYIRRQGDDEFLWNTGFHFGDWLGLDAKSGSYVGATPKDFIATAFYAYSADILSKTAGVLGKIEDEAEYTKLHENIIDSFRKEFITPSGRLSAHTQTGHVLALMFGLVEEKHRKRTVDTLVKYIEENGWHLTTGFVGTPYLCRVLSENGRNDVAYKLLLQKDCPSWLYQVLKGATTMWEHWDGIKEDGTFWSPDMNSFNHYAYGSIGDWLYRDVAGIDAGAPGYSHICIRPRSGDGLEFAEACFESMFGEIRSAWRKNGSGMEVDADIPANTSATILLPHAEINNISESGVGVTKADGIRQCENTDKGARLEVGSGCYRFCYSIINN